MRPTLTLPMLAFVAAGAAGCPSSSMPDVLAYDVIPFDNGPNAPMGAPFCTLGGSNVAGAVPPDFCLRRYAMVHEPRALVFAPNGDLFVSAPSVSAPGGASGGPGAIVVLADDAHSGAAQVATFADGIGDV